MENTKEKSDCCGEYLVFFDTIDGRRRERCGVCGKSTKLAELKEKIMASAITEQRYAVSCCSECFNKDVYVVQRKRQLKAKTGYCGTCRKVFDADTIEELKEQMQSHTNETDHLGYWLQQSKGS